MDEFALSNEERRYWLALSVCDGIGPIRFQKLIRHFGSAKNAWFATENDLKESGIGEKISSDLITFKKEFSLDEYEEQMAKSHVEYLTLQDSEYPELLKSIKNPPNVLYKKGTLRFNNSETLVSVVGTRKVTEYGKEVTEFLVTDLVSAGCFIVSGLAMGVDAIAHKAAITAGGITIAVLGSGVDICTPAENTSLYTSIIEHGGVILSENRLGQMPNKGSFPMRNRIIAGLSQGVLVTEGSEDSGSLITANDAFKSQRKVFAVPGPITSSVSKGPISLINKGAKMVMSAGDIISELGTCLPAGKVKNPAEGEASQGRHELRKGNKRELLGLTKQEKGIIIALQDQNLHFDELVRRSGLNSSQLGIVISLMEMKGLIKSLESGVFGLTT
jgi:DNA processing protein